MIHLHVKKILSDTPHTKKPHTSEIFTINQLLR